MPATKDPTKVGLGGIVVVVLVILFIGHLMAGGSKGQGQTFNQTGYTRETDGKVYFTVHTGDLPTYCDVSAPALTDVIGEAASTTVFSFTEVHTGTWGAFADLSLHTSDYGQTVDLDVSCSM